MEMNWPPKTRQPIRVSILGLGYVGSVMAACLARLGHWVVGVDVNPDKVQLLNSGRSPVVEPGLDQLIQEEYGAGRLCGTTDATEAISRSDISLVCVGTPCLRNGKLDTSAIIRVVGQIGEALAAKSNFHTVAVRSTVLPGTIETVVIPGLERASGKQIGSEFAVCSNPEFMREGSAIKDFLEPPFTVIGAQDKTHIPPLRALYSSLSGRIFETSLRTAEMAKYACNAFHAMKVDFANEVGTVCQHLGVSADEVMNIACADRKLNISSAYLTPGFAFGGSCLPKDLSALVYRAKELDLHLPLLEAILPSNQAHIERAIEVILASGRKKIGFLGLSFKPGSDDLRESPVLTVVKRLLGEGRQILIHDSCVSESTTRGANRQFAEAQIPHVFSLLRHTLDEVLRESDLIVLGNRNDAYDQVNELLRSDQALLNLSCLCPESLLVKAPTAVLL